MCRSASSVDSLPLDTTKTFWTGPAIVLKVTSGVNLAILWLDIGGQLGYPMADYIGNNATAISINWRRRGGSAVMDIGCQFGDPSAEVNITMTKKGGTCGAMKAQRAMKAMMTKKGARGGQVKRVAAKRYVKAKAK